MFFLLLSLSNFLFRGPTTSRKIELIWLERKPLDLEERSNSEKVHWLASTDQSACSSSAGLHDAAAASGWIWPSCWHFERRIIEALRKAAPPADGSWTAARTGIELLVSWLTVDLIEWRLF